MENYLIDISEIMGICRPAKEFPQECLPDLVRLLHANPNNKMFLAREFLEFWRKKTGGEEVVEGGTPSSQGPGISKRTMVAKILEVGQLHNRYCTACNTLLLDSRML